MRRLLSGGPVEQPVVAQAQGAFGGGGEAGDGHGSIAPPAQPHRGGEGAEVPCDRLRLRDRGGRLEEQEHQRHPEHGRRQPPHAPAESGVPPVEAGPAALGGGGIGGELVFVAAVGHVVAALQAEAAHRHLDVAAGDGEDGGQPAPRLAQALAVQIGPDLAGRLVLPVPHVDGVHRHRAVRLGQPQVEQGPEGQLPPAEPLQGPPVTGLHPAQGLAPPPFPEHRWLPLTRRVRPRRRGPARAAARWSGTWSRRRWRSR